MATSKADKAAKPQNNPENELLASNAPKAIALDGEIITSSETAPAGANEQPTPEREAMVFVPAAPALVATDTTAAKDGDLHAGTNTMDIAGPDTDVSDEPESALAEDEESEDQTPTVLFVYWPNIAVLFPAGLGVAFDEDGAGQLTEEQAGWLAEQIASGNLPEPPAHILPQDLAERVAMVRTESETYDGPTTADVHPDEVVNWLAAGWVLSPLPQGEGEGEGD